MSSERTNSGMQSISSSLAPLAKKILGRKGFAELDIITNWADIVGKEIAEYAYPQSIEFKRGQKTGGTLFVCVDGGAFATELTYRQVYILNKVNTYFGYAAIEKLQIIQVQQNTQVLKNNEQFTDKKKSLVTLKEQNYIDSQTAGIKDENLRQSIKKLGMNIFMQKEDNKE